MSYAHISKMERFYIEQRISLGDSILKIAQDLGRHKSSLYREIKRNTDETFGFFSGLRADTIANERQSNTVRKESFFDTASEDTLDFINTEFEVRSSPDQIAEKLKLEKQIIVSHQTIYRHIWDDRTNGGNMHKNLRRRGKKYRLKSTKIDKVKDKKSIELREPKEFLVKKVGHWEIDTIFGFEQKSFLLTMVDISTKYTIVRKIPNKEALTVYNEIMDIMATTFLPFKSITSDNGTEFAEHARISKEANIDWFYCHPYSSWERGLNENTNGLIRDFYPKRTDFRDVSDADIRKLQNILNNRLRKILGYVTPVQALMQHVMAS